GIGDAASYQIVDAGHDVFEIGAAPIGAVAFDELLAVADGAANIRVEDGVAAGDEELPPGFDAIFPGAGRAAMDQRDKREFGVAIVVDGFEERGFNVLTIEGFVFVDLGSDESELLPGVVEMSELLGRGLLIPEVELLRLSCGLADEEDAAGVGK